ncbi:zinc-dependent alcohol dehydrogenase [Thermoanaerobacterium thermosaccharolyticum]|uniref:zinc-dependent alcohol dehydrogenase n=1 Tax=Thermoanaerobacterium thermosaccharolyticum TaxID=1517 RepID=UPI003DA95F1E
MLKNKMGIVIEAGKTGYIEKELPKIGENQVLIEIKASAICGSDLHIFKGKHPSVKLPVTVGHEFSGRVIETGSCVNRVVEGDRVTVEPVIICGKCEACHTGKYGYCENLSFTYREGQGSMAQYFVAEQQYVYKLPEYLSYEAGALIEPFAVATHAVRRAEIKLGDKVMIFGAGAIGILIAALCRANGATDVAVVDLSDTRLKKALELGATVAINPLKDNLEEKIAQISGSKGMDKTFECVGLEETFVQAMTALKKNGLLTVVGIFEIPTANIPVTRFITHEIKVQGAQGYCWDFPIAINMTKTIDLSKLITHTFSLDELQKAFETALDRRNNSIKVIVKP